MAHTSLQQSPTCAVNIHHELQLDVAVIVDMLRKHFRKTSFKDTNKGYAIPSTLLPSLIKRPVLG